MLTALILLPALGAVVVALLPNRRTELYMPIGVTLSLPALALAGYVFSVFEPGVAGFQFVERAAWYEPWAVYWHLGLDGISLPLVMLTVLLVPISLAASTAITHRVKEFVIYTLLLEAGLIGVFLS